MQYSQEHLKTMVYAKFGGQTECIMGNWKIENALSLVERVLSHFLLDPGPMNVTISRQKNDFVT